MAIQRKDVAIFTDNYPALISEILASETLIEGDDYYIHFENEDDSEGTVTPMRAQIPIQLSNDGLRAFMILRLDVKLDADGVDVSGINLVSLVNLAVIGVLEVGSAPMIDLYNFPPEIQALLDTIEDFYISLIAGS